MNHLWRLGYACEDIITNIFRVCKTHPMGEFLKLEFIKEIGMTHMRIVEGVNSLLQLSGLLAKLCKKSADPNVVNPQGWLKGPGSFGGYNALYGWGLIRFRFCLIQLILRFSREIYHPLVYSSGIPIECFQLVLFRSETRICLSVGITRLRNLWMLKLVRLILFWGEIAYILCTSFIHIALTC